LTKGTKFKEVTLSNSSKSKRKYKCNYLRSGKEVDLPVKATLTSLTKKKHS